jgi:RNA polymerase sigma-70 factor, ECF subfamily
MGTVGAARAGEGAAVVATLAEGRSAFAELAERHRPALHLHCYRMTGSLEDAEGLVQETLLRAWRGLATYRGRSSVRSWLYGIATNACLDALQRRRRGPASGIHWLQPYPDRLLEAVAPSEDEPEAALVATETVELAFLAAIQHLPPRQRAVLITRDVLGWSARRTAALLDTSFPAVNSSLQRARATLRKRIPARRLDWAAGADPTEAERAVLQRYVDATERDDLDGLARLMSEEARFSMPPEPGTWTGRQVLVALWAESGFGTKEAGRLRCLLTRANRQPAVASYIRRAGDPRHAPMALDVLRIEDGLVAEIVTFGVEVFPAFGLPPAL